ncbi:GatB/YqeY domain-containing protein [Atopococcus tabaci]|uniref:GatB/YqeY domain-containing protein n=1 Tax=Atopococcus tabaci TaxID=269774 RepID=UPI00041C2644|nr:GatB/YqeY domain-containing protein [Atopococcus tabaci]
MSLLTKINEDVKTAMKAKDKERLAVLRMIKSSLHNEQISKGHELTDEEELTVLSREKKQRADSLEEFKLAGRDDLVQQLEKELSVVNEYLPEQLSEEELRAVVQESINEANASSMKDMGSVMGVLMPKVKGRADGKEVSRLVKELLTK